MDCIRQNHTYKLEHTMFVIAMQEQHLIIAVLHLYITWPTPRYWQWKPVKKETLRQKKDDFNFPIVNFPFICVVFKRVSVYLWVQFVVLFSLTCSFISMRVITKLPNSEQSYKGKVNTHRYINRQNQSTTHWAWCCFDNCFTCFVQVLL
jgi:hypothetical protein